MENFFTITFWICLGYFLLINFYHFIVLVFSWRESVLRKNQDRRNDPDWIDHSSFTIPISILMPAYNEASVILDSVEAVLKNQYRQFELIIVNDGSTDNTLEILKEKYELQRVSKYYAKRIPTKPIQGVYRSRTNPNIWVIDKVNGGTHADAANAALNLARFRYILTLDADTLIEPDALYKVMRLVMQNPKKVVGVGATVGISNGFHLQDGMILSRHASWNILVNFQLLEYFRAFFINRLGWSRGNFNMCVSGAFGLWRRDVVLHLGGFQTEFSCDDLEMTYRVHKHFRDRGEEYQILSLPDPVCWTEAPGNTYALYQQRHRWQRVTNECAWHYKAMLFNPKYGKVGWIGAPYMFFAEVLGPWLEVFSYLLIPLGWIFGYLSLEHLGYFLLASAGLTAFLSMIAITLFDGYSPNYRLKDILRLMIASSAEFLGYRQVLSVSRLMGSIASFFGVKTWNKFEREKTEPNNPRFSFSSTR